MQTDPVNNCQLCCFVCGILCCKIFNKILRHGIHCFRQNTSQRMVLSWWNHHAVGECRLFQQSICHGARSVTVHKRLCHVIVDEGSICFTLTDSFHHFLSGTAHQFFCTGCHCIFNGIGYCLVNSSNNINFPIKVTPCHPCHLHRNERCRNPPFFRLSIVICFQACIDANICGFLIFLISNILISGGRCKKLIGNPGIVCNSPEVIRDNPLHLTIFIIRIWITGRITQNMKRIVLGILWNYTFFFLCIFQILSLYAFIIFIIKCRFPVTLNCIHLVDCIIDLIQQFCITFFNNDIELAAVKFIHDTLIVCFPHRSGSNRINISALKSFLHLCCRIKIKWIICKSFIACKIRKLFISWASVQKCHTHTVVSTVIAIHNRAVVTADGQNPIIGSDRTWKTKLFFSFRCFAGRCYHINLAIFKHLLHIIPALIISDIFVIYIPITGHQPKKIIAIPTAVAFFIHHMITIHGKETDFDSFMLRTVLGCICSQGRKYHTHAYKNQ